MGFWVSDNRGCDLVRTDDAGARGFADFVRGELRREVERHQVLDGGIDRLELRPVEQCLLCVGDGRLEVGLGGTANAISRRREGRGVPRGERTCHDIGKREAALADMLRHYLCELALAEVDVEVRRRGDRDRLYRGRHFSPGVDCKWTS